MANRPMIWLRVPCVPFLRRARRGNAERHGGHRSLAGRKIRARLRSVLDGPWELESDTKVRSNLM